MIFEEIPTLHSPESLAESIRHLRGLVLLRSDASQPYSRFSLVTAEPFITFRSHGTACEIAEAGGPVSKVYGNPWSVLENLLKRFELPSGIDLPLPAGGCFGFWGYDLRHFVEPKLPRMPRTTSPFDHCHVGFYDSLVAFDHALGKAFVISTGMEAGGTCSDDLAKLKFNSWSRALAGDPKMMPVASDTTPGAQPELQGVCSRTSFVEKVRRAQVYIRAGDIYQVNLAHLLTAAPVRSAWALYRQLAEISPAPFSAFIDTGRMQLVSTSPELFLSLSGRRVVTRPIKGTRPRSLDATKDAQLTYELQTSSKEIAELVMITDLLRNDLGRICEYGSVHVPELMRLERFAHVQHQVSTVEGTLKADISHLGALASCFPGGSVTGAPKFRAMEIIDELEDQPRGPYTGCIGWIGFNDESRLSIVIRTAVCHAGKAIFHAGAGIVADSVPEAEYDETIAKARGFMEAISVFQQAFGQVPAATHDRIPK